MKASELRLGNLITSDGEIFTVDEIRNDFVSAGALGIYPAGFDCDLGIPLTEEWLLKFGFVSTDSTTWAAGPNKPQGYKVYRKGLFSWNTIQGTWWYKGVLENQPQYVHQLQNLYFALTGEELTIKEGKDKVQNEWAKEHGQQTQ